MGKIKKKIKRIPKIIYWAAFAFCFVSLLYFQSEDIAVRNTCKELYAKEELTAEELKISTFAYSTVTESEGEDGESMAVQYKRLYGAEYVGAFELDESEGIEAILSRGKAKVLILDEAGEQRFYREVSELYFEPGEAGKYDIYFVGNKYTGRVVFSKTPGDRQTGNN